MRPSLIGCEFSGVVRRAMRLRGINAWSIDLEVSEDNSPFHIVGDLRTLLNGWRYGPHHPQADEWGTLIAFPPCTFLCNSGIRWLYKGGRMSGGPDPERWEKMREAVEFFKRLRGAHVPRIALENPRMHKYAEELLGPGHGNFIQPWQFGHREVKATGFTLKNLPPLVPTKIIRPPDPRFRTQEEKRKWSRVHYASPGADRWKERSRTLQGIADAMADQWGSLPV